MLKILTYNIHKGFSVANLKFVLHQIREEIQRINADLVFLQEIQGEHQTHKSSSWQRNFGPITPTGKTPFIERATTVMPF